MKTENWISINDRLPDEGQIIVIQHKERSYLPVIARYKSTHGRQFLIPYTTDWTIDNVTHWIPLPEPPK